MAEKVLDAVCGIRDGLRAGNYHREADISAAVVGRLLLALGWGVFEPQQVSREFPIGRRRVDYALHAGGIPVVLLEVKDVGKANAAAEEQLFQYCFHQGVPIAVLTDGRLWRLFFPAGQGNYQERCFCEVDLLRNSPDHSSSALERFLSRSLVKSGLARTAAETALNEKRSQSLASRAFGSVLSAMLAEPDAALVESFVGRVHRATGVRPGRDSAVRFLQGKSPIRDESSRSDSTPVRDATPASDPKPLSVSRPTPDPTPSLTLTVFGETRTFDTAKQVFVEAFRTLAGRDAGFCDRVAARPPGRSRRYVARERGELHPGAPKFARRESKALPGGWWLGTQLSNANKRHLIRKACEVAGVRYGDDLVVNIPTTPRSAPSTPSAPPEPDPAPKSRTVPVSGVGSGRYTVVLEDETRRFRTAKDAFVSVFEWFAGRDPGFLERFAAKAGGRSVNPVARDQRRLYLKRPERGLTASERLPGGWWIATHNSSPKKEALIRQGCEVAELRYGVDVQVNFPVRHRTAQAVPEPHEEASPYDIRDAMKRRSRVR